MTDEPLIDTRNLERKTLRDEFAMAALQGFCANPALTKLSETQIAKVAYLFADSMLVER